MRTEIKEELGIDIPEIEYKYVKTIVGHNKIVDLYFIRKNIDICKLKLQTEEVEKVKWATEEEIEKMIKKGRFEKTHSKLFKDLKKWINEDFHT